MDDASILDAFYSKSATTKELDAAAAALATRPALTEHESFIRNRGERVAVKNGPFCPKLFAKNRIAKLEVGRVKHPRLGAIIERIPVPAPKSRPEVRLGLKASRLPWEGPINEALRKLAHTALFRARLVELAGPPTMIAMKEAELDAAFVRFVNALGGDASRPWPAPLPKRWKKWQLVRAADQVPDDTSAVRAILYLPDGRLLVQRPRDALVLDHDGGIDLRVPAPGTLATSVSGTVVAFTADARLSSFYAEEVWPNAPSEDRGWGPLSLLDVKRGRWLDEVVPKHTPRFVFDSSDGEGGAIDLATGNTLQLFEHGSHRHATTHDGRYVWIGKDPSDSGVVLDLESGLAQVAAPFVKKLRAGAAAVVLTPKSRWLFFSPNGELGDEKEFWKPALPRPAAAAFSHDAGEIALAYDDEIVVRAATKKAPKLRRYALPGEA